MKKHNRRLFNWLRIRAWNQQKRQGRTLRRRPTTSISEGQHYSSYVTLWQGGEPETAICTRKPFQTPQLLCFDENVAQTTGFLALIRRLMFHGMKKSNIGFVYRKKPKGIPKIQGYADFSSLNEISLSAAVVLTADFYRVSDIIGQVPPTINLHKWQDPVVTKLHQLGFFSLLGHVPSNEKLIKDGTTLTMSIVRGTNADELQTVDESLKVLGEFLRSGSEQDLDPTMVKVLTTISEAITNVTQHAYNDDHEYEYQHINSFWVAATADKQSKTLTVVVYDQGATIPVTYPRLDLKAEAIRFLRTAVKSVVNGAPDVAHRHDGTYIRAAMRYGGSRTDEFFRGKGLPQMFALMQTIGSGQMNIRSRGGWCIQNAAGRMTQGFVDDSIGGTLVEWTIKLSEKELGANDAY